MRHARIWLILFAAVLVLGVPVGAHAGMVPAAAPPAHGLSLYGPQDLKYAPGETYAYANPDAPKGGLLRLGTEGEFTKLNPFSLKGAPLPGLAMLVFDTLADGSYDEREPFAQYGLVAERFQIAPDRLSATYFLNQKAKFSDGVPLTADDVVFSFNIMQDPEFSPMLRNYYSEVSQAEKLDAHTVRFHFRRYNQELPLILGQLAILPKHVYGVEGKVFGKDFDAIAVGSGPYTVEEFKFGDYIVFKRNPDYWGKDLPVNRGRYNFDRIRFKAYLSPITMREALKGNEIDLDQIGSAKDWVTEFNGPYFQKGYLVKRTFPSTRVSRLQAFAFNLRRPVFQDVAVRRAVAAMMDFPSMNRNLFYDMYLRQRCIYDNSPELMSRGPAAGEVRDLLLALAQKHNRSGGETFVPEEAITRGPYTIGQGPDGAELPLKDKIHLTNLFLDRLGWKFDPQAGARRRGDTVLRFEILLDSPGWQRLVNPLIENLREIGIKCSYRLVQPAEMVKKMNDFDFDFTLAVFGGSDSPGNELIDEWGAAAADTPGSNNVCGVRNPAVDEMIGRILAAKSRHELVVNVQALDRILCAGSYFIPTWYLNYDRIVCWNQFGCPAKPSTKAPLFLYYVLQWWWFDETKAARLQAARAASVDFVEPAKSAKQ